jgi:hypothetical protein
VLQLKLDFILGLSLSGLGLDVSFQLHPRDAFAAGLPGGPLCRDTLRCRVRSG